MNRWIAVVAMLALSSACDAGDPACGGPRPALDDCVIGAAWAECGDGEGDPVLACGGGTPDFCRWFAGGCVADGFDASPCPADDVCCIDGFPYPGDRFTRAHDPTMLVTGWGTEPWDRTRERAVEVSIASVGPSAPSITCAPSDDPDLLRGPCAPGLGVQRLFHQDVLTLVARTTSIAILFWELTIEVIRDRDDTLHARVCRNWTTDAAEATCPDRPEREPACAISGTLTLDAFPETTEDAATVHAALSAIFADGVSIDLRF